MGLGWIGWCVGVGLGWGRGGRGWIGWSGSKSIDLVKTEVEIRIIHRVQPPHVSSQLFN